MIMLDVWIDDFDFGKCIFIKIDKFGILYFLIKFE